ncbi:MAG: hypothetical protein ACI4RD_00360 [Kiritimatiellia bacterium]
MARACIDVARIETRNDMACVLIFVPSEDREVARQCAAAFANEIIDTQEETERTRLVQAIDQLKRNCDKQERFVAKLAKQLEETMAVGDASAEIASLEEGLFKQKKILNEMREAVSRIGKEKDAGFFFGNMTMPKCNDLRR